MSRSVIRRCIAYLLIALLPLQAVAAGRLALCAEMTHPLHSVSSAANEHFVANEPFVANEHCAQMGSMQASFSDGFSHAGDSHKPQASSGCWLGSICLASLGVFTLPAGYSIVRHDRIAPVPLPKATHYHSVIAAVPQRPPTIVL